MAAKGAVHHVPRGEHGVGGAPGLLPPRGDAEGRGQVAGQLLAVAHVHVPADARADGGVEIRLRAGLDDEGHGLKAGAARVVERIGR